MVRKLKTWELNRPELNDYKIQEKIPIICILDNMRSALNVGAFFRTADAFAIQKLILCGITAKPPHKEITKTAIGATESVDWEYFEDITEIIHALIKQNYTIISIEQTNASTSLYDLPFSKHEKYALIFGNEVEGVSEAAITLSDFCIEIPQYGTKHSLNVSVCGGVVLWEFSKHYRQNYSKS